MSEKIATREAYGKALVDLGEQNKKVVVLDADLAGATMTKYFKAAHPDRFFDCGIAEANMMNIGAGLSTMGLVPFCSTFAMFGAGRAYEQIRNSIAYPKFNVKICCSHAGVSVGAHPGYPDLQGFGQGLWHIAFYFFHNAAPFSAARRMDSTMRS